MVRVTDKKWWSSWTIWFNVIIAAVAIADALIGTGFFSGTALKIFGSVVVVGNVLLRIKTKEGLK